MAEAKGAKDTDDAPKGGGGAKGGDDKADAKGGGGGGGFEVDTECDDWRSLPIYKGQALAKGEPLVVLRSDGTWKYATFHSLVGDTLVATVRALGGGAREAEIRGGALRKARARPVLPLSLSLATRARSPDAQVAANGTKKMYGEADWENIRISGGGGGAADSK